jgi:endonuclease/exonuclease/phosphatase family metal-dependent hydrolase
MHAHPRPLCPASLHPVPLHPVPLHPVLLRLKAAVRLPALPLLLALAAGGCGTPGLTTSSAGGAGDVGGGPLSSASGSGSAGGAGSGEPGKPFTLVNWNIHNFFDTTGQYGTDALSPTDYAAKRKTVGAALKQLAPDVAVLAEIETEAVLADLATNELGGIYPATAISNSKDIREIAILSKVPFDAVVSHAQDTFTLAGTNGPQYHYTRDCLEAHVTWNGRKIVILGVHFRSKASPDDPDKRTAEAQHTRAIAEELAKKDPSAAIVILGDFNDLPGSDPVNAVAGAPPALYEDASASVAMDERYSYIYQGSRQLIDHQMANPIFGKMLDKTSVRLVHGAKIDDNSQYASDHTPLLGLYAVR